MTRDDDRARHEFTSEAEELLDTLSRDLVDFENQGKDVRPELVNKIFREVHSLKGLAGMLGFGEISELSHNLEDMLDRLRMGKIPITRNLVDLMYDSVDSLNRLVIAINDQSVAGLVDVTRLTSRIHQMVSDQPEEKGTDPFHALTLDEHTRRSLTEYEEHRLLENVRSGKTIVAIEVTFDFSDFDEKLRALTAKLTESGEVVSTLPALDATGGSGISFRLLYGSALEIAAIQAAVPQAKVTSLRKSGGQAPPPVRTGEAPVLPEPGEEMSLRSVSPTVRVDIAKLDHVMNIVGELLIEKTQLEAATRMIALDDRLRGQELSKISRNLHRKMAEMQRTVIEMRMVPVGQIYAKLSRAVRKTAREVNKEIELVLRGEDTELDKMMVEELTDPLMHIIRNALDHGIETAQERERRGKPPVGRITLNAYQQGNSVVIDVKDDGRGIDVEKIRKVALERELIDESETVDQLRAYELMFTPGFSTAAEVSEISGRGVGLDVVKKNIQDLKGSIEVISESGQGTTFRIILPITLAIIQALIVRAASEQFAIPLTSVDESLRIYSKDIKTVERREVFNLRDTTIPLLRLADAFGGGGQAPALSRAEGPSPVPDKWFVVVTRSGDRTVGVLVDALVRQQEIVIKSIGQRLKAVPGIAGATEIGDGEIVLVVDTASLIERFGGRARESRALAAR